MSKYINYSLENANFNCPKRTTEITTKKNKNVYNNVKTTATDKTVAEKEFETKTASFLIETPEIF